MGEKDQDQLQHPGTSSIHSQIGIDSYQLRETMYTNIPFSAAQSQTSFFQVPTLLTPQQHSYYQAFCPPHIQEPEEQLKQLWRKQSEEILDITDFRNHSLPLARIKKIMKADGDVKMIAAETPVLFAKACEMFIQELMLRSRALTDENKRRTLQKSDIMAAIAVTEMYDFLVDIIPSDEVNDQVLTSASGVGLSNNKPFRYNIAMDSKISSSESIIGGSLIDQCVLQSQHEQSFQTPQMWQQDQLSSASDS